MIMLEWVWFRKSSLNKDFYFREKNFLVLWENTDTKYITWTKYSFGYAYFISNKLFLAFKGAVVKFCLNKAATIVFLWVTIFALFPENRIYQLLFLQNQWEKTYSLLGSSYRNLISNMHVIYWKKIGKEREEINKN